MGADRFGRRAEDGTRLKSSPPIGRVYGRRRGRRLAGQKAELIETRLEALTVALPEAPAGLDPMALFSSSLDAIWLEIGFGTGEHLAAEAASYPEIGFIGCEPFLNGVSNLLVLLEQGGQNNVRIVPDDARRLLLALREGSIGRAFLLFPDPWPKRRHESRRFLSPRGLDLIARVLADSAELRVATDHRALGEWMEARLNEHSSFDLAGRAEARPDDWAATRYEAKALQAGRRPAYLSYGRRPRAKPPAP